MLQQLQLKEKRLKTIKANQVFWHRGTVYLMSPQNSSVGCFPEKARHLALALGQPHSSHLPPHSLCFSHSECTSTRNWNSIPLAQHTLHSCLLPGICCSLLVTAQRTTVPLELLSMVIASTGNPAPATLPMFFLSHNFHVVLWEYNRHHLFQYFNKSLLICLIRHKVLPYITEFLASLYQITNQIMQSNKPHPDYWLHISSKLSFRNSLKVVIYNFIKTLW